LATPADIEQPLPAGYPTLEELNANDWLPLPRRRLPFRAIVAASSNDPLANLSRIYDLAQAWDAEIEVLGQVGHLNPAAGFGRWDAGLTIVRDLDCTADNVPQPYVSV
jgi:predicted alpha/beta hydrolase family esterase